MKRILLCLVITALISTMVTVPSMALGGSLGAGLHYLRNLGDIDSNESLDLSKDSFGLIGSYQFGAAMMTLERRASTSSTTRVPTTGCSSRRVGRCSAA